MTTWAYECRPADEAIPSPLFVACMTVDGMPRGTSIVRVKVGPEWVCAHVDRRQKVEVAGMLLREVIASSEADCPECVDKLPMDPPAATPSAPEPSSGTSGRQVQAAAMALRGHRLVVVLVNLDLVNSPGEADMAIADLQLRFGGVDIVLMGQQEDGSPKYHGEAALVEMLAEVPLDRMPWKSYPIG